LEVEELQKVTMIDGSGEDGLDYDHIVIVRKQGCIVAVSIVAI
jgi:hypothetical protein